MTLYDILLNTEKHLTTETIEDIFLVTNFQRSKCNVITNDEENKLKLLWTTKLNFALWSR